MESINTIETLKFFKDFKRKLLKKGHSNSTECAIETSRLFHDVIRYSIENNEIKTQSELILLVRHLGKKLIAIDQVQFCIGNIIKRILYIIREEINKNSISKNDFEFDENILNEDLKTSIKNLQAKKLQNLEYFETKKPESESFEKNIESDDSESEGKSKNSSSSNNLLNNKPITQDNKDKILNNIDELINELEFIDENIINQANEYISDNDVILTSNKSQILIQFFSEVAKTKKFKVFITESAPSLEGITQAEILVQKGVDTTVISDNSVYGIMPKITKVIIGTKAIMVNGGLISYNGVYNVCLCAKVFLIPVIVVGGTSKITPVYSFRHQKFNEYLSPSKIFDVKYESDISNFRFNIPAYDYIPPEFITIYITNIGSQNPAYIYRIFSEMYSQEDYLFDSEEDHK